MLPGMLAPQMLPFSKWSPDVSSDVRIPQYSRGISALAAIAVATRLGEHFRNHGDQQRKTVQASNSITSSRDRPATMPLQDLRAGRAVALQLIAKSDVRTEWTMVAVPQLA